MASQATGSPEKPRSGPSEQLVASFRLAASYYNNTAIKVCIMLTNYFRYGVNEDRLRRMLDTFLQRYRDTAGKETIGTVLQIPNQIVLLSWLVGMS